MARTKLTGVAPPTDVLRSFERRRERAAQVKRASVAVVGIIVALVGLGGWFVVQPDRSPQVADPFPPDGAQGLGIFEPFAGKIVYGTGRDEIQIQGIDPDAVDPSPMQLDSLGGVPIAWSSDGTELLLARARGDAAPRLFIVHADGAETPLPLEPKLRSDTTLYDLPVAMSADGSRVAFATRADDGPLALYVIDVESGRISEVVEARPRSIEGFDKPVMTAVYAPTFSPDGSQIAYVDGLGDSSHSVWVVDVDGSDAHMVVENEATSGGHVFGLTWAPTGERIALGVRSLPAAGIYTFSPDGSEFTRVIKHGLRPSWSPDGSRIAYDSYTMIPCPEDPDNCWSEDISGRLGVADADGSDAHTFGGGASGPWHPHLAGSG